jgi:hypothetical protein
VLTIRLAFLSNVAITSSDHGRNKGYWYNYLYKKEELEPWVEKVNELRRSRVKVLRVYFNNHYGGKAVANALQFREVLGEQLSDDQKAAKQQMTSFATTTITATTPLKPTKRKAFSKEFKKELEALGQRP